LLHRPSHTPGAGGYRLQLHDEGTGTCQRNDKFISSNLTWTVCVLTDTYFFSYIYVFNFGTAA
jgi:hypothetical protein